MAVWPRAVDRLFSRLANIPMPRTEQKILRHLGCEDAPLLGAGGEAEVYQLDEKRVLRIAHAGASFEDAADRARLLTDIATGATHLPFGTPVVDKVEVILERPVSFERRYRGSTISDLLSRLEGRDRIVLLTKYLNAVPAISTIAITQDEIGPLLGDKNLRSKSWQQFCRARLERSQARCPADLQRAVMDVATSGMPEPSRYGLVHLDYFPANVLADNGEITAVLDFGGASILGDPRLDVWSAVAYLDPELSPAARDEDRELAMRWMADLGLSDHYPAALRWLAAHWAFAANDPGLMAWCRRILLA